MNLGYNSAMVICKLILYNPQISKAILAKNQLGDEGAYLLAKLIRTSESLVYVDLSSNELSQNGGNVILQALQFNQSIIDINLSSSEGLNRNTIGSKGVEPLRRVLALNKFLIILNLSGNFIGNKGLGYICEGLRTGRNQTLIKLNLSLNDINADGMEYLQKALPYTYLKDLNLSKNAIKNKGATILGQMITSGSLVLQSLDLSDC